ncbi:MAG: SNF2-related protein [bacterium]|nr:SNF2-related protein [bacterium]
MARLEDLKKGARVRGVTPTGPVTVIDADWIGADALTLTYEDGGGVTDREILYRANEADLELVDGGRPWPLDADPALFKLVAEAKRISLAYLFDPYLATETSDIEVLPHQIEAVYGHMLPLRPLRFLLADDPGAGKTIMAGLLIKELMVRGDLGRCLIVVPGGLAEQWQDELGEKFGLEFELLSREMVEASRSGNPLLERPLLVARLDMLARNDDLQARLAQTEWDLVVVDEAHKMSASFQGAEVRETKRYRLGRQLEQVARHFVLMTATPHNGKPEDFQLFMALLDSDRFAGKFRRGTHSDEPPRDLMRRMVKEELLRFDGTPLFPERVAKTAKYPLSEGEHELYEQVTEYVRTGMNRAERLRAEGQGGRSAVVGFALTILQRRLASSPLAIWRSIQRRRARLGARLVEVRDMRTALEVTQVPSGYRPDDFGDGFDDGFEPDDLLGSEVEAVETEILDAATAARTVEELEAEIADLGRLEELAETVYRSGADRKWEELADLLQNTPEMLDAEGRRHKLIVFTEHRDTLEYLQRKLAGRAARRETGRYQVVGVPASLRRWDDANRRGRLLRNYERICFEHDHVSVSGRPVADLVAPGHPLLDATVGVLLERHGSVLRQGTTLIDPQDWTETPRLLVFLEHEIVDGTTLGDGRRQVVSRRFEYVEITETGDVRGAGRDPHIDLRAPDADEQALLAPLAEADWVIAGLETTALRHAGEHNAPQHLAEVQDRVQWRVKRTLDAVESRLKEEIRYWGAEALRLKDKELAGQSGARLNSALAGRRAAEAEERLQRRRAELALQGKLSVRRPRVVGGALVVPAGLVAKLAGTEVPEHAHDTVRTEKLAVAAVLATEREFGRDATEMPHNNEGYDVETRADDGRLLFIEVKGRVAGADRFTVTNRELNYGLNNADRHILALVRVDEDDTTTVRYLYDPFGGRESEPSAAEYDRRLSWDA